MNNSARSRARVRFLALLSVFVLLTSVFSWLPATAQDGAPDPTVPAGQLEARGTGDANAIQTLATPAVSAVTIACSVAQDDIVDVTVSVTDPTTSGTTFTAYLVADGNRVSQDGVLELNGNTSYLVNLQLQADAYTYADTVRAKAFITGDEANAVTSEPLAIHQSNGGTLCGTAPEPTATNTPEPTATNTPEPTATNTPESTATNTPESTATNTPESTATNTPAPTVAPTTPATQYATVTGTSGANLRCRTAPVTGDTITLLPAGSRVELRGAASDGWYPVKCGGRDGFASAQYLTSEGGSGPTPPPSGEGGTATVRNTGGAGLRCRTAPVSGGVITVLADGTKVPLRGAVENGWAPVTCAGQSGWISTEYALVESGGGATSPTPTPTPPSSGGGTGTYGTVVNTGGMGLRCRTEPVDGAIITVVPEGTKLETRGAASNGWHPVKCNGQDGYVSADYFTTGGGGSTPPPASGGSGTAMVSGTGGGGLRCRTAPVDGDVITVMPEGSQVTTRGNIVNGWAPVKCAGQDGWAAAAYLLFNVDAGSGELWFDVNLSTQYMRVYRGNTVIMQTYVSTGRPGFDTPTGTFYINRKLPSQTMSGVLGGEYYYVPNVPWVMYFTNRGHAIHGAYWHNNFGHVMSHGCINLPVKTAEWLYSITPIGTRVRIHY